MLLYLDTVGSTVLVKAIAKPKEIVDIALAEL